MVVQDGGATIRLDEQGSLLLRIPLDETNHRRGGMGMGSMMVLVEETIQAPIGTALG